MKISGSAGLFAMCALAQTLLSFEAASIKPHRGIIQFSQDPHAEGRRVVGTASTLLDFITVAYQVRYDQIGNAPKWADTEHYDFQATGGPGDKPLSAAAFHGMLQALLADRFQLRVHRESLEVPVYALVVAKHGPKLATVPATEKGGCQVSASPRGNHLECAKGTLDRLVTQLTYTAGHPVEDRTGLTDFYKFTLDWWPANRSMPANLDVPDMFHAVEEQLGLRLEAGRGTLQKLVIDHAEKPTEN
ncbi:MAG TPA: TIGR03435 family protein [Candidatus Limnocylindrales bacterium]|nr:TIGR03435 family protein [Candidatus Limnocylindrales bacterium]